jgi:hypothetical protein
MRLASMSYASEMNSIQYCSGSMTAAVFYLGGVDVMISTGMAAVCK